MEIRIIDNKKNTHPNILQSRRNGRGGEASTEDHTVLGSRLP